MVYANQELDNKNKIKRMVILMFCCMFIYNLGHPSTPSLIELRKLPKSISGEFLALMNIAMFISSPYLGAIADNIGMKKIFRFVPFTYGVAQLLFGYTTSLGIMIFARLMAGFASGGTHSVALGYVGQLSKPEDKAKNIAKMSSAAIIGGAIGQKVGGLVGLTNPSNSFGLQFVLGFLVSILIQLYMVEIVKKNNKQKINKKQLNPLSTFKYIKELDRSSKLFCLIICIVNIGIYSYSNAINYFLRYEERVDSNVIGTYVMVASLIAFFGTSFLLSRLVKLSSEQTVYKSFIYICLIIMLIIIFRLNKGIVPYALMAIYTMFYEIIRSIGNTIMSKKSLANQGKVLGVATAVSFLGSATGSLMSGHLLQINKYLPFVSNLLFMSIVGIIFIIKPNIANVEEEQSK